MPPPPGLVPVYDANGVVIGYDTPGDWRNAPA